MALPLRVMVRAVTTGFAKVMALPLRVMVRAVTTGRGWLLCPPKVSHIGIPEGICAASK